MLNEKQDLLGSMPLTEQERNLMLIIFRKRLKLMISVLLIMTVWILYSGLRSGEITEDIMDFSFFQMMTISMVFLFVLVYSIFSVYFFKRVFPFYRDYKNNQKEAVKYTITMKRYFAYTNQYFIGLDHPDYLFHQIEAPEWSQLEVGETYPLFRAYYSKYVFNIQGRYFLV